MTKLTKINLWLILTIPLIGIFYYPFLPEQIVIYWSDEGFPYYTDKQTGTIVFSLIIMSLMVIAIAVHYGFKQITGNHITSSFVFEIICFGVLLFLISCAFATFSWNISNSFDLRSIMLKLFGLITCLTILLIVIYLSKNKMPISPPFEPTIIEVPADGHYKDHLIEIKDNQITFEDYYFPFGKKTLAFNEIESIEPRPSTLANGKFRYHGSGGIRTWYPADNDRDTRSIIFILNKKNKWTRIGFTATNSNAAYTLLHQAGLIKIKPTQ